MTTNAVTGKSMTLSIEGDVVGEAQSFALHFAQSTIDVTSKDSTIGVISLLVARNGALISADSISITITPREPSKTTSLPTHL